MSEIDSLFLVQNGHRSCIFNWQTMAEAATVKVTEDMHS